MLLLYELCVSFSQNVTRHVVKYSPVPKCGGVNPIQDGLFRGCSLIGEGQKAPPPLPQNISHKSCNDKTWHSYALPTEDPKNI